MNLDPRASFGKKRFVYLGGASLLVVALGIGIIRYSTNDLDRITVQEGSLNADLLKITAAPTEEVKTPSPLNGLLVKPEIAARRPLAIMIENHPEARPQFGLGSASVVYEAIAEGGITRFMAIFGDGGGSKVGPVRSARPYYLDWALEYDAGYAHVGGSPDALKLIRSLSINDLDQFSIGAQAFRRIPRSGIATEHTMYTDTDKLHSVSLDRHGSTQDWDHPEFKEPLPKDVRPAGQTVSIDFSGPEYLTRWHYDPETNTYLREMAGNFHKDAITGETIRAANLFVPIVTRQLMNDPDGKGRWDFNTVGSGKGWVFQDGRAIDITWQKASHAARTIYQTAGGETIQRNPGLSWFAIVHPDTAVIVSDQLSGDS